jgi:RNA polymerase sigma factor (sigma-70 family)
MSPLTLRRYRAERLLREEFEGLRARVIATVQGRLGASSLRLDRSDLDACYAQAWQGLYAALLDGQEIANPAGWLTLVTFRRAIEELRAHRHIDRRDAQHGPSGSEPGARVAPAPDGAEEPDFAAELEDRVKLRQLFEGLRGRLSVREREAAAFCYLQGLSRSEAAARMGISEARMRKLMDGQGPGRPGVAGKVGALADTIREGGWCEEQGSLMRGLAYGILDPGGERYRLALIHRSECPACRAYVVSLRGLAAVLPPVLLPWGLGAGVLVRAGAAGHTGAGIGAGTGAGAPAGAGITAGAGSQAGVGIGGGLSASGAAGVGGAAGGSWLLAGGPLSTKLAVGCLLALGVGAGCVALNGGSGETGNPLRAHHHAHPARADGAVQPAGDASLSGDLAAGLSGVPGQDAARAHPSSTVPLTPAQQAEREFGPESTAASGDSRPIPNAGRGSPAKSAAFESRSLTAEDATTTAPPHSVGRSSTEQAGARASAAEREFGVG